MASDEPFGVQTVVAPQSWFTDNWPRLQSDIQADAVIVTQCRTNHESCSPAALQFVGIVDEARQQEGVARIGHINRAVNLAIRAKRQEGPLVWKSPLAILADGESNCNGYATVKYAALGDAGIRGRRLISVHIKSANEKHLVASVRDGSRWIILDNRTMLLIDSRDEPDYAPLLEFERDGVWRFVSPSPNVADLPCSHGAAVAAQDH